MNVCGPCGLDFTGAADFDSHRVGKHDYTFWEGMHRKPPKTDGRRCISEPEMVEMGWFKDRHGRWSHPRRAYDSNTVARSRVVGKRKGKDARTV